MSGPDAGGFTQSTRCRRSRLYIDWQLRSVAAGIERTVTSRSVSSNGHQIDSDPRGPDGRLKLCSRRREHAVVELHSVCPLPPTAKWYRCPGGCDWCAAWYLGGVRKFCQSG